MTKGETEEIRKTHISAAKLHKMHNMHYKNGSFSGMERISGSQLTESNISELDFISASVRIMASKNVWQQLENNILLYFNIVIGTVRAMLTPVSCLPYKKKVGNPNTSGNLVRILLQHITKRFYYDVRIVKYCCVERSK